MFWKVTNLNEISFLMDYDFPNFNVNLADFKLSPYYLSTNRFTNNSLTSKPQRPQIQQY